MSYEKRLAWPLHEIDPIAKANCSAAVRLARDVVSDIGVEAASASGGLAELARCSTRDAERDTRRVLVNRHGQSLRVPLQRLGRGKLDQPVFRLRDWLQFVVDKSCFHICTGLLKPDADREQAILRAFWMDYALSHGDHPVYELERQNVLALHRCVPFLYHGDEGRGRRRNPFLVCSWFSMIGRGTHPGERAKRRKASAAGSRVRKPFLKLCMNFRGHSFTNRFLQVLG